MFFKSGSKKNSPRGFTLVEVVVTSVIMTLVFGGLLAGVRFTLDLLGQSKAIAGATALANERMEYIKSLPYDRVGTIGSPPYGSIPQNSTTTLNGIEYAERVLITYIDDPADGLAGADHNGIFDDYKLVKLEYRWQLRGKPRSLSLISNVVPIGIESTTGGGTIRVNVLDAAVSDVENAAVHFINNSLATTTDTIRYTNNQGQAFLSGAPAGANYEIFVTKSGYSSDQTYVATTSNPNPDKLPVAVASGLVSTVSFFIDQTSDLFIKTLAPPVIGTYEDDFSDDTNIYAAGNVVVDAGLLRLADNLGVFETNGEVVSASTTPATIVGWQTLYFDIEENASTNVGLSVYYQNGPSLALVPDSVLPGNSAGFDVSPIDMSAVDPVTYPTLAIGARLSTSDTAMTPVIRSWGLTYIISEPTVPNVDFRLFGEKTIGRDASSKPILKYDQALVTDAAGELNLTGMEWDVYDVDLITTGYDLAEICQPTPLTLNPGVSADLFMTLIPSSYPSLRVLVTEADGTPIIGANVNLQNTGINQTSSTSLCGQTFFNSGLVVDPDYTLTASKSGYTTNIQTGISVNSGTSTVEVILTP